MKGGKGGKGGGGAAAGVNTTADKGFSLAQVRGACAAHRPAGWPLAGRWLPACTCLPAWVYDALMMRRARH
jgi:hypothetical protein